MLSDIKLDDKRKAVVNTLLEYIENNPAQWQKGWFSFPAGSAPQNAATGKPYRGINALNLMCLSAAHNYSDPRWATFNQITKLGGRVKRGERSTFVFFWSLYDKATKKDFDDNVLKDMSDEERNAYIKENVRRVSNTYSVFNAEQCENLPTLQLMPDAELKKRDTSAVVEQVIKNCEAKIYHDQTSRAFYSQTLDEIHMPKVDQFKTINDYYATALHEVAHSTGHESRLNRLTDDMFVSPDEYAQEELRAEMASVFMQLDLGITLDGSHIENHASYLKSWLEFAKSKPDAFFRAAADADKISLYVSNHYLQSTEETDNLSVVLDEQAEQAEQAEQSNTADAATVAKAATAATATTVTSTVVGTAAAKVPNWLQAIRQKRFDNLQANVPQELKNMPNWCAFSTKKLPNGKFEKKIWDCNSSERKWAKSNDPATWTSFDKALAYAKLNGCDGLSLVITKDSKLFCIDLDHAKGPDKRYSSLAWNVIHASKGTYTERSVSGNGLHIFGRKLDQNPLFDKLQSNNGAGFEMYDYKIISMTGDRFSSSTSEIKSFSTEDKIFTIATQNLPEKAAATPSARVLQDSQQNAPRPRSDREVINAIRRSKKGAEFDQMFDGKNICGDKNRTDLKMLNILAFFTNGEAEQMKRIFQQSALYRPTGKSIGYLDRSINLAIKTVFKTLGNDPGHGLG